MEKRKRTSNMPDFAIACSTGRPLPSSSSPSYASLSREETQNIGIANQYIAKRLDSYILDTLHFPILCHPLSHHNTKQKPRLAERLLFGFMVAQRAEREDGKGRAKDGKERRIWNEKRNEKSDIDINVGIFHSSSFRVYFFSMVWITNQQTNNPSIFSGWLFGCVRDPGHGQLFSFIM